MSLFLCALQLAEVLGLTYDKQLLTRQRREARLAAEAAAKAERQAAERAAILAAASAATKRVLRDDGPGRRILRAHGTTRAAQPESSSARAAGRPRAAGGDTVVAGRRLRALPTSESVSAEAAVQSSSAASLFTADGLATQRLAPSASSAQPGEIVWGERGGAVLPANGVQQNEEGAKPAQRAGPARGAPLRRSHRRAGGAHGRSRGSSGGGASAAGGGGPS